MDCQPTVSQPSLIITMSSSIACIQYSHQRHSKPIEAATICFSKDCSVLE